MTEGRSIGVIIQAIGWIHIFAGGVCLDLSRKIFLDKVWPYITPEYKVTTLFFAAGVIAIVSGIKVINLGKRKRNE